MSVQRQLPVDVFQVSKVMANLQLDYATITASSK